MSNVTLTEFFRKAIRESNAQPLSPADVNRRGLVLFRFIGGPCCGDVLYDSEEFSRRCHEQAGRTFDRSNTGKHGPCCVTRCGTLHQYATDFDGRCYLYVGPVGRLQKRGDVV